MKTDLRDVTFLMIVRIDTLVRLENLMVTTRFLQKHFECRIMVFEVDDYNNGIIRKLLNKIDYRFCQDSDSVLYRTKYINEMVKSACTPFVCVWDVDVIVSPGQILESVNKLRNGKYDMAIPYDGRALDTSKLIRNMFIQNPRIDFLDKQRNKMKPLHDGLSLRGGAFFANKEAYIESGLENLSFYGWGSEDFERYERWNILGYKVYISSGVLYHLTHPRGQNSKYHSKDRVINSEHSLFRTRVSSADELKYMLKLK